jgi:two-component sensor histidine kinase
LFKDAIILSKSVDLACSAACAQAWTAGALSRPLGQVVLSSVVRQGDNRERQLVLIWDEATGTKEDAGERRFGSIALERVVPQSLDGHASLTFADGHLNYRLEVPAPNFEIE